MCVQNRKVCGEGKIMDEHLNRMVIRKRYVMFPFKQKTTQKRWGIILTMGGIAMALATLNTPAVGNNISPSSVGFVISAIGIMYLLEVIANG